MQIQDPKIIKNILNDNDYNELLNSIKNPKSFSYCVGFSRYTIDDRNMEILNKLMHQLIPVARKSFNSESLIPTYALFAHYEGQNPPPSLYRHKDDNACTYTVDMCVYQKEPWDLWVDNKPYTLYPNEALAYYGNDQEHWREKFPNPQTNHVAMIFFHYAEPNHWWFTKGRSYLEVIRNKISEEQWNKQN
jgi:hypothetical protein